MNKELMNKFFKAAKLVNLPLVKVSSYIETYTKEPHEVSMGFQMSVNKANVDECIVNATLVKSRINNRKEIKLCFVENQSAEKN